MTFSDPMWNASVLRWLMATRSLSWDLDTISDGVHECDGCLKNILDTVVERRVLLDRASSHQLTSRLHHGSKTPPDNVESLCEQTRLKCLCYLMWLHLHLDQRTWCVYMLLYGLNLEKGDEQNRQAIDTVILEFLFDCNFCFI